MAIKDKLTRFLPGRQEKVMYSRMNSMLTEIENNVDSEIGQIANPALNINPDFQINQRGKNLYTCASVFTATYTWDRWQIIDTGQVESTPDGIKLTMTNVFFQFRQFVDINANILHGKKVTLSCKVGENIYKGTGLLDKSLNNTPIDVDMGNDIFLQLRHNPELSTPIVIRIMNKVAGKTLTGLKWVKLELGEIATPLSPRPVGEELALCKRYYQIVNATVLGSTGRVYRRLTATDFVQMRIHPTVQKVISPSTLALNCIHEFGNSDYILGSNSKFNFTLNGPEFCEIYAGHNGANMDNINYGCYIHVDAEIY